MGLLPGEAGGVDEAAVSQDPAGAELYRLGDVAGVLHEGGEFRVRHLVLRHPEVGHLDGVDRLFRWRPGLRAHEEDAALDFHHFGHGDVLGAGGGGEEEGEGGEGDGGFHGRVGWVIRWGAFRGFDRLSAVDAGRRPALRGGWRSLTINTRRRRRRGGGRRPRSWCPPPDPRGCRCCCRGRNRR